MNREWIKEVAEIETSIRRYATIGNGTALVVAFTSLPKAADSLQSMPLKLLLTLFFLGLILSVLHLIFLFFYQLSYESRSLVDGSHRLLSSVSHKVDESGLTDELKAATDSLAKEVLLERHIELLRNLQEYSLWLSLLMLVLGIGVGIYSL